MSYTKKTKQIFTSLLLMMGLLLFTSAYSQDEMRFNDAEIAHVVVVANQIDVDYGEVALNRIKNPEIRKFAETMIKDHNAINEQAKALVAKLGVKPEDNDLSKTLMQQKEENLENFKKMNDSEFTAAYINNEVAYHEAVINAVKDVLIPQAENEELKETLVKVTPLLEHHLEMAKNAQKNAGK